MRYLALVLTIGLAGCGQGAPGPQGDKGDRGEKGDNALRIEQAQQRVSCRPDETMVNAICFSDPGGSVSASTVHYAVGADGSTLASCLTGGRNIRAFCAKR
jgi:hypothetical protein